MTKVTSDKSGRCYQEIASVMMEMKGLSIRGREIPDEPPPSVLVLALPSYLRRFLFAEIGFCWLQSTICLLFRAFMSW